MSTMVSSACPTFSRFLAPRISCAVSSSTSRPSRNRRAFWQRNFSHRAGNKETAPFDRAAKLKQRTRAANAAKLYRDNDPRRHAPTTIPYDYFHREVANRLVDRLDDILTPQNRGFPLALEIGCGGGDFVWRAICCATNDAELDLESEDHDGGGDGIDDVTNYGRGGVRKLVQLDSCREMLHRDDRDEDASASEAVCETYKLVADEERHPWSFPEGTFDLVISSMAFHWVNDLPKLLLEIKRVLKPDGCLLFALPGGNTLPELRSSLVLAELERTGGVSTHLGPYIDVSNVGGLLTGTGFKLPTVDVDEIAIGYPNMMVLMEHLNRMGEGNACKVRKDRVGLGTFLGAACVYRELYPDEEGEGVVASAQVIYGIAWKEHESQQKPLERGSATKRMTEIAVTKTSVG